MTDTGKGNENTMGTQSGILSSTKIEFIDRAECKTFSSLLPKAELTRLISGGCFGIGTRFEDEAAGILLFEGAKGFFEITWVFVQEKFRRQGIGTSLVENLMDYAKRRKLKGLLAYYSVPEDGEARAFFQHCGFEGRRRGNLSYRIPCRQLEGFSLALDVKRDCWEHIVRLDMLPAHEQSAFLKKLEKHFPEKFTPEKQQEIWTDCSVAYWEGETIEACLLCSIPDRTTIRLECLYGTGHNPTVVMILLQYLAGKLTKDYPDYALFVSPITRSAKRLTEKLVQKMLGVRKSMVEEAVWETK